MMRDLPDMPSRDIVFLASFCRWMLEADAGAHRTTLEMNRYLLFVGLIERMESHGFPGPFPPVLLPYRALASLPGISRSRSQRRDRERRR